tara:strand:+ start:421 stop:894 length:474 start_codon:yes stop_codon:yes gene_type:complete
MSEKISNKNDLRYNDAGNVHMDFHGATNTTIEFIIKKYGIKIMDDIFFKVGKEVYKDLRENIKKGNIKMLAEHWDHFFGRENSEYKIELDKDQVVLTVKKCRAYEHVKKIAGFVSPNFCDQTIKTNQALSEGTEYVIDTKILGEASCQQIIRKKYDT